MAMAGITCRVSPAKLCIDGAAQRANISRGRSFGRFAASLCAGEVWPFVRALYRALGGHLWLTGRFFCSSFEN
jgi:hypothetical protein